MATDILTGGTAGGSNEDLSPSDACDDLLETFWLGDWAGPPSWWKYDLGTGVTKKVVQLTITPYHNPALAGVCSFTLLGSNNDSDWDSLYSSQHDNDTDKEIYNFSNSTAYRYYKIDFSDVWVREQIIGILEIEMFEGDAPAITKRPMVTNHE